MLWKEGKSVDLLDELIGDIFDDNEVLRCVHVALLCVEVEPKNRPLMSSVVMMLASENATLPQPNEPYFTFLPLLQLILQPYSSRQFDKMQL
jgi:hypothetical protein